MRTIATTLVAMLAVALAALPAFAQETTIKVPQGSGVFPTVGQVNCLEELGTGRLCAATYQCSEGSGRLWGDLANHDGRRAINQDSPVARGRDCTITVDGRAEVRWLTAYAPRGRDSELAGLTTSASALRPVVSIGSTDYAGEDGGSLLAYILQRHNTTLADIADLVCPDLGRGTQSQRRCKHDLLRTIFGVGDFGYGASLTYGPIAGFADLPENAVTRCLVELYENPAFCDALRRPWPFWGANTESCNEDGRVMAYHLMRWPRLYWTFSAVADFWYGSSFLALDYPEPDHVAVLIGSEQGRQCRALAVDRLQTFGVELIDDGWMTIGD